MLYKALYEVLDVPITASQGHIKKRWRQHSLENHPDKTCSLPDVERHRRSEVFKAALNAYEVLVDPSRRQNYDEWLSNPERGEFYEEKEDYDNYREDREEYSEEMFETQFGTQEDVEEELGPGGPGSPIIIVDFEVEDETRGASRSPKQWENSQEHARPRPNVSDEAEEKWSERMPPQNYRRPYISDEEEKEETEASWSPRGRRQQQPRSRTDLSEDEAKGKGSEKMEPPRYRSPDEDEAPAAAEIEEESTRTGTGGLPRSAQKCAASQSDVSDNEEQARKRKRWRSNRRSPQGQRRRATESERSQGTSNIPMPLYGKDSYNVSLGPGSFRYERDISYLRWLGQLLTKCNTTATVVGMVRTDDDRKKRSSTFAEYVVIGMVTTGKEKGEGSRSWMNYRVYNYDITGARIEKNWARRGSSIPHGNVPIYGYWLEPFDTMRQDELVECLMAYTSGT